ncbi:uncharacterized protein EDB91DRAFT_782947 [Suillus paluster]|uniref:uncharacterized protein n=1 Tax=Suillus paluster TaxID=48578 RepID=UPI001B86969A|nr:uncharacterized protein EDB91DRAFT_782947 [Suillus paluster]KAG1730518.1 hypothetical protein EDB91DRAFT_782947 [Suillus paluster]
MNPYSSPKGILDASQLRLDHRPLEPGTLIFRTTSSHFSIVRRHSGEDVKSCELFYHGLFNILSNCSTWVGSVILSLDPAPLASLEFIVLSRTTAGPGVYDEECLGRFYSGCMLYVMAVSESEGLMERVGFGVIMSLRELLRMQRRRWCLFDDRHVISVLLKKDIYFVKRRPFKRSV